MSLKDTAQEMADAGWSLERERDRWREIAEEQDEALAKVAAALAELDAMVSNAGKRLRAPSFEHVDPYFQGRLTGGLDATSGAANSVRRALGMDTP